MSVFRMILRELICDYPGCEIGEGQCGGERDVRDLRRLMRSSGWTYTDGKDFCCKHSEGKDNHGH